jgi:hypothetical protein
MDIRYGNPLATTLAVGFVALLSACAGHGHRRHDHYETHVYADPAPVHHTASHQVEVALVFERDLGCHSVRGRPHHYYYADHYLRHEPDGWRISRHIHGPWRHARAENLPPGLRERPWRNHGNGSRMAHAPHGHRKKSKPERQRRLHRTERPGESEPARAEDRRRHTRNEDRRERPKVEDRRAHTRAEDQHEPTQSKAGRWRPKAEGRRAHIRTADRREHEQLDDQRARTPRQEEIRRNREGERRRGEEKRSTRISKLDRKRQHNEPGRPHDAKPGRSEKSQKDEDSKTRARHPRSP